MRDKLKKLFLTSLDKVKIDKLSRQEKRVEFVGDMDVFKTETFFVIKNVRMRDIREKVKIRINIKQGFTVKHNVEPNIMIAPVNIVFYAGSYKFWFFQRRKELTAHLDYFKDVLGLSNAEKTEEYDDWYMSDLRYEITSQYNAFAIFYGEYVYELTEEEYNNFVKLYKIRLLELDKESINEKIKYYGKK